MPVGTRFALTAVLLLATPAPLFALSGDRNQPIRIVAQRVEVDQKEGVSRYLGNVKATQGSMRINAERLIVRYRGREIESIAAFGKPATFRQRLDKGGEITGSSLRMEYDAVKHTLRLSEDAKVHQGEDTVTGPIVHYNIDSSRLYADGSPEERVFTVLQPRKSDQAAGKESKR